MGNIVGAMFRETRDPQDPTYLAIADWVNGDINPIATLSESPTSYAFLSHTHILLPHRDSSSRYCVVLCLISPSHPNGLELQTIFHVPDEAVYNLGRSHINVYGDPTPSWGGEAKGGGRPFFIDDERTIKIEWLAMDHSRRVDWVEIYVPAKAFLRWSRPAGVDTVPPLPLPTLGSSRAPTTRADAQGEGPSSTSHNLSPTPTDTHALDANVAIYLDHTAIPPLPLDFATTLDDGGIDDDSGSDNIIDDDDDPDWVDEDEEGEDGDAEDSGYFLWENTTGDHMNGDTGSDGDPEQTQGDITADDEQAPSSSQWVGSDDDSANRSWLSSNLTPFNETTLQWYEPFPFVPPQPPPAVTGLRRTSMSAPSSPSSTPSHASSPPLFAAPQATTLKSGPAALTSPSQRPSPLLHLAWPAWGPDNSRMMWKVGADNEFQCFLFGTRVVSFTGSSKVNVRTFGGGRAGWVMRENGEAEGKSSSKGKGKEKSTGAELGDNGYPAGERTRRDGGEGTKKPRWSAQRRRAAKGRVNQSNALESPPQSDLQAQVASLVMAYNAAQDEHLNIASQEPMSDSEPEAQTTPLPQPITTVDLTNIYSTLPPSSSSTSTVKPTSAISPVPIPGTTTGATSHTHHGMHTPTMHFSPRSEPSTMIFRQVGDGPHRHYDSTLPHHLVRRDIGWTMRGTYSHGVMCDDEHVLLVEVSVAWRAQMLYYLLQIYEQNADLPMLYSLYPRLDTILSSFTQCSMCRT
ncbi:hypothetical protein DL93DRAFT_729976 [Clavulina sp. PMI_390]|nr:hypothetical protein DL93DRAFT_729976 [Clavulina sp. PMI_390]